MNGSARVLAVDDEPQILRALETILTGAGYEVETAITGEEALARATLRPPDAIVLDLMLPGASGTEVCRELRGWTQVPILVISIVGDEEEKIDALDAGADDYITKPFSVGELLARLRAALRRSESPREPILELGDLRIDLDKHGVVPARRAAPSDATRVPAARPLRPQRGASADAPHDPPRCLGPRLPGRASLRPRLRLASQTSHRG